MKDYSTITYTSGSFPDVVSVNASTATAKDGTPLVKDWLDDIWGFYQALMSAASLTPDGSAELHDDSQLLQAVRNVAGHPGEIVSFGGLASVPAAVGARLLLLSGQVVARADYPELDAAVYCGDETNPTAPAFYHTSDLAGTTRNSAGGFLVLPDPRGRFVRASQGQQAGHTEESCNKAHQHARIVKSGGGYYLKSVAMEIATGADYNVAVFQTGTDAMAYTWYDTDGGVTAQPDLIDFLLMIRY